MILRPAAALLFAAGLLVIVVSLCAIGIASKQRDGRRRRTKI